MTVPSSVSPRLVQLAASLGFVVVLLDVSVVNVALGVLQSDFRADMNGLQWVINAYTLAFAALLITAGTLGDRIGTRRTFAAGFLLFAIASLACGVAGALSTLIAARLGQGVGAALLVPNSLALLNQVFHDPVERSRAVGWWGAGGGIALAAGPVVGGILIAAVGWRGIFLVNVPVGLLGLWLTLRYAPKHIPHRAGGFDLPGQVTAALALACWTIALTETSTRGWSDPAVIGLIAAAMVFGVLFVWLESNTSSPMVPLDLFRQKIFSSAITIGLIANLAFYGSVFLFSLYFQEIRHLSAQQTGFAFLPMMGTLFIVNIIAGRIGPYIGPHRLTALGMGLSAIGYCLLLKVSPTSSYWVLAAPMLLAGSGIALAIPTITSATLTAVPKNRGGVASGLLNTARQMGGMMGVALFGYFVRNPEVPLFMRGMHQTLTAMFVLLMLGAVVGFIGISPQAQFKTSS